MQLEAGLRGLASLKCAVNPLTDFCPAISLATYHEKLTDATIPPTNIFDVRHVGYLERDGNIKQF
jgi:hypothetical protein